MQIDINKQSFSQLVEDYARKHKDIEYLEAIVAVCEEHQVDPRDCKRLLSKSIIEHLMVEAKNMNLIVDENPSHTLPI
jgi:predicted CopG family antitoxin